MRKEDCTKCNHAYNDVCEGEVGGIPCVDFEPIPQPAPPPDARKVGEPKSIDEMLDRMVINLPAATSVAMREESRLKLKRLLEIHDAARDEAVRRDAFESGYAQGHNDTVESCVRNLHDAAEDYLKGLSK